jgi:putative AlgH/UPF0301 family transcriptional regulator
MPQVWVLLVLVLSVAETAGPAAGGPVTGMVGAPVTQEFSSEAACRRAGESMDVLLGYAGWAADRRFVRVQWTCVPK